jgi:hypothetical protein
VPSPTGVAPYAELTERIAAVLGDPAADTTPG